MHMQFCLIDWQVDLPSHAIHTHFPFLWQADLSALYRTFSSRRTRLFLKVTVSTL